MDDVLIRKDIDEVETDELLIDSPKDQNNQVQHELNIDDIDEEALLSGSDSETDCDENFIMSSSTRKGSSKRERTDTSDQPLSSTRRFSSKRAHNDTQSPSDSPQSLTPSTDDPSTVPLHDEQRQSSKEIQKNVRGPTRGDRLSRELKNDKITNLTITYNKGELRVYGDNASDFTTNVGVNVRHHAPLQYSGWSKVPPAEKKAVYARIQDVFKLDFAKDPYLEVICDEYCKNAYSNHRHNCHRHYKKMIEEGKNPLEHRPTGLVIKEADWKWMCTACFSSEEWKKKSVAGSKNRSKVKFMHRGGSKSFTQHLHETKSTPVMDVDEGQSKSIKAGEIETFKKTHYTEKNGWINQIAEEKYKEMIELREDQLNQLEAGTLIMVDDAAIYRQVLGDAKYGWLRGTGPVIGKKLSIELSSKSKELQEQRIEKLEKIIKDFTSEKDGVFEKYIQEKVDKRVESLERKFLEGHKFQSSSNKETNPPQQWPTPPTMDKTYRLTLGDGDVVAIGEIFPGKQVHGKDLEKGNVRVCIIECLNENARLPVHVRDDLIFVKDAVQSFVAWPEHLIIFGDSEALKTMEKNEHLSPHMPTQKASTSSMNVKDSPVPFVMPKIIPRSVKAILLSVQYRKSREEYRIEMDPNIFGSDQDLYIEPKDIVHLGTNVEIGAECIAFYIRILHERLKNSKREKYFRFIHPSWASIVGSYLQQNVESIADRLASAGEMQLSLIPINLGYHWVLIIIDPSREMCFWLNPTGELPSDTIKNFIAMIFDYYNASKKKTPRAAGIIWKIIKCNNRMENYYTNEEIDEIRIEWADAFIELI
ncbi:hypothetical protein F8388_008907 [Cannabis sativa]|uniref:Ubiquitin-like protease family profile domain-containing protein n=1 Tax=Cannabis sativa TaxID=3483 RepID=A0A7J6H887_CANSA|nr:hypothetical protein F8388_008907 [Cannabis sativa]